MFRFYAREEKEQDDGIGNLPKFQPVEKAVFIKNFKDIGCASGKIQWSYSHI